MYSNGLKIVTYAMLGHLGDVVEGDLVGVARRVCFSLLVLVDHGTDDSRLGVFEGGVAPEVRSLLLICVFFSHSVNCRFCVLL